MPYLDYNVSPDDYLWRDYRKPKHADLIKDFLNSGKSVAEIKIGIMEYSSATTAYTVFKDNIRNMNLDDTIKVFTSHKRLFIMRIDMEV